MSKTLFEMAGGEEGIHRLCSRFYDKVFADPLLVPLFEEPDADHAGRLAYWLIELLGGPPRHQEKRGGFSKVVASHYGLKISEEQRQRWLAHMLRTCEEEGWPDDLMDSFRSYLDVGTRAAMHNSNAYPGD